VFVAGCESPLQIDYWVFSQKRARAPKWRGQVERSLAGDEHVCAREAEAGEPLQVVSQVAYEAPRAMQPLNCSLVRRVPPRQAQASGIILCR
jgi:hypothetical protein